MGSFPRLLRHPAGVNRHSGAGGKAVRLAAAIAALALTSACNAGGGSGTGSTSGTPTPTAAASAAPVTAVINQLRDNYSQQIIAVQLTNNTAGPLTVLSAGVASPLFSGTIEWQPTPGGIELPPGQTKILPAQLRAPECGSGRRRRTRVRRWNSALPGPAARAPDTTVPATTVPTATVPAADPYGVLDRNNAEMCLAQAAAAVAGVRLEPELEVSADGRSAVLHLSSRRGASRAPRIPARGDTDDQPDRRDHPARRGPKRSLAAVRLRPRRGRQPAVPARDPAGPLRSARRRGRQGGHPVAAAGVSGRAGRGPENRRRSAAAWTDLRLCYNGVRTPVVCWHVP